MDTANIRQITSRANPLIKQYIALSNSARRRREAGLFVLEGLRLCRDALEGGARLQALMMTQDGLASFGNIPHGTSCYCITPELAKAMAQTVHSQGIFAICHIGAPCSLGDILKSGGRYIILDSLGDVGNLGTILRTADAFALDGVICVGCPDIYAPKVVRAAMGALCRVPVCECADMGAVLTACRAAGVTTLAAVVTGGEDMGRCSLPLGCAVVIGNEARGVCASTILGCDGRITIPMAGRAESLNASVAAGILIWGMCGEK